MKFHHETFKNIFLSGMQRAAMRLRNGEKGVSVICKHEIAKVHRRERNQKNCLFVIKRAVENPREFILKLA